MNLVIGTLKNFDDEVLKFSGQVLVDFWAPWCGPCLMLSPTVEGLAQELPDVKIVKVNVDENPDLANQYNVSSIPNVTVFDGGKVKDTLIGFRQKQDYLDALAG